MRPSLLQLKLKLLLFKSFEHRPFLWSLVADSPPSSGVPSFESSSGSSSVVVWPGERLIGGLTPVRSPAAKIWRLTALALA